MPPKRISASHAMRSKVSVRLVIDASIAGSATAKDVPVSRNCREFLLAILEICHRIVMTPELRAEWKAHQTKFVRTWLRQMRGRKKIIPCDEPSTAGVAKILNAVSSEHEREAVHKDLLLLTAALATDRRIASRDDRTRNILRNKCAAIRDIAGIVWVNPANEEENVLDWLKRGAPIEESRKIAPSVKRS